MSTVGAFRVRGEFETLDLCGSHSIARYGDGELRVAIGGGAVSQRADPRLAHELRSILREEVRGLIVAVPNFEQTPCQHTWRKYREGQFAALYVRGRTYGSSFVTRPDNAPWIDRPAYWQRVRELWQGKHVVLVTGDRKSLTDTMMSEAASLRIVAAPAKHAYTEVDRIEREIGTPSGPVLMCLGCTATVLAARLHRRGVHALDLGHIGMFMRHAGAFEFSPSDLASPDYRRQLQEKHSMSVWGKHGGSHAPEVETFLRKLGGRSVLDYGCGRATLAPAIPGIKVFEYDPGIPGKDGLPKPADLVVCTDVLEHIEPHLLNQVLRHIYLLSARGTYLVIATRPARETLPDGRNAHLIIESPTWWIDKLRQHGWTNIRTEQRKGLCVWLEKPPA